VCDVALEGGVVIFERDGHVVPESGGEFSSGIRERGIHERAVRLAWLSSTRPSRSVLVAWVGDVGNVGGDVKGRRM